MDTFTSRVIRRMQENIERQYGPSIEAFRRMNLAQSDTLQRLMEVATRVSLSPQLEQALRLMDRHATLWHTHGVLLTERFSALRQPMEQLSATTAAFQGAIRRVTQTETTLAATTLLRLQDVERVGEILAKSSAVTRLLDQSEFLKAATAIKAPWIEALTPERSLGALSALQSLGETLRQSPFGTREAEAIRQALGDWRNIALPETLLTDLQARTAFYRDHGFDSRLTALPEPAFTESLRLTGVWQQDLFSPVLHIIEEERAPDEEPSVEDAVRQRMIEAYDALFVFERDMRSFLNHKMTTRYGKAWLKQRIPPTTLANWRRKSDEEERKGLPRRGLIEYADFTDYLDIITRADNWDEVFKHIFPNKEDLRVSFYRLSPLRICTMHGREISKDDYILLLVETRRVQRAIRQTEQADQEP